MSFIKRILSLALTGIMVTSFASCRSKDESILTYGNLSAPKNAIKDGRSDIRSALYLFYLLQANNNFINKVAETSQATTVSGFDYKKEKVDNKSYDQWVVDEAIKNCAAYSYVEIEFQKLGLRLTESQTSEYSQYANEQWEKSVKAFCEINKISKETFELYCKNQYKFQALFNYYYGKGGSKEIKQELVKQSLNDNYVLVDAIMINTVDSDGAQMSAEAKKKAKAQLETYKKQLKSGKPFAEVKKLHDDAQGGFQEPQSIPDGPKDKYASVISGPKTLSPVKYYDKLKALKPGDIEVVEYDDCFVLVVRKDILDDPFYLKTRDEEIRKVLKDKEFQKFVSDEAAKLKVDKNQSALNTYKVGKLQYPSQQQQQQQQPAQ